MEYTFSTNTYEFNMIQEYGYALFTKDNGTLYFGGGSWTEYVGNVRAIEQYIATYINSTSEREGLYYGYAYLPYDSPNIYIGINRQECSYFAFGYLGQSVETFKGYQYDITNEVSTGYIGQRNALNTGVSLDYTYNTFVPITQYTDISVSCPYREGVSNSCNGLLFDYEYSNNSSYHNVVTAVNMYNSYFVCSTQHNFYLRFGENESNNSAYYNNGYNNGYQDGKAFGFTTGKAEGYSQGYTKGLAEGGNAPVGFMSMIGGAVEQFTPVLNLEVLPNITLGTCISIPVICTMLVIIFRIARG